MKVTVVQLNPTVGAIEDNTRRIIDAVKAAATEEPDLVVFPELSVVGYPPRDLLLRESFIQQAQDAAGEIAVATGDFGDMGVLFGVPWPTGDTEGRGLYNSAALAYGGEILATRHKSLLPTYDVFDEDRYFDPAPSVAPVEFKGEMLGISVCEDAWNAEDFWPKDRVYEKDPVAQLAAKGASLLINISASPFHAGKDETRYRLLSTHARSCGLPIIYANQVGANDELVFDGGSMCLDAEGQPVAILPQFEEAAATFDTSDSGRKEPFQPEDAVASVHDALVLGVKDYTRKCGFDRVVVGLSGGIDSALTVTLAADALGSDSVLGVTMPSDFSSKGSVTDSQELAQNLGIDFEVIPISGMFHAYLDGMDEFLSLDDMTTAEENIQARIRGNILMAISNKRGHLVLSTGNKSELAVGYCTLYGDMTGGLAVLSDVPKGLVYDLAGHINRVGEIIPQAIIDKPPSAELKPDQTDQDTLPPYPVLDEIIELYVEQNLAPQQIIARGLDSSAVAWTVRQIDHNEYKRRQAAPGLRVTTKAFGTGRRMPIAARYSHNHIAVEAGHNDGR